MGFKSVHFKRKKTECECIPSMALPLKCFQEARYMEKAFKPDCGAGIS